LARSYELTLLDLIQAVSEVAANDQETLATVIDLINNSGRVRLRRDAGRAMIDLLMKADAAA
jgi:predicted nucleic-acid-binding protein